MAFGSVNSPGAYGAELRQAVDSLAAAIISGDVSAPLEVAAGDVITTRDGAEIRAHRKLNEAVDARAYTDMVVSAAVASVTRMVEREYIAVH